MNLGQHILIFLVRVYRCTLSPAKTVIFGPLSGCRFTPSCSAYALEALRTHGALAGSWLSVKRICRCHPWSECGHDPVPERKKQNSLTPALSHRMGEGESETISAAVEQRRWQYTRRATTAASLPVPLAHPMGEGSGVRD